MAEYIERTEKLIVAVNAGARVIENTKRYHGATYCMDVFSDHPREIPYLKAAEVLRGFGEISAADVVEVKRGAVGNNNGRTRKRVGAVVSCSPRMRVSLHRFENARS